MDTGVPQYYLSGVFLMGYNFSVSLNQFNSEMRKIYIQIHFSAILSSRSAEDKLTQCTLMDSSTVIC